MDHKNEEGNSKLLTSEGENTKSMTEAKYYDYVVVGGGIGAAYFTESMSSRLGDLTMVIVSSDPGRLRPVSALSY